MEIVIITFSLQGMNESEYERSCDTIAPAIAAVPGLVSKAWLADRNSGVYGGVYTFENGATADGYLASEIVMQISANPGFANVSVRRFEVLAGPTAMTRGLVGAHA
jgi:hypothetical protein